MIEMIINVYAYVRVRTNIGYDGDEFVCRKDKKS